MISTPLFEVMPDYLLLGITLVPFKSVGMDPLVYNAPVSGHGHFSPSGA
jgi:hypothetical protein